MKYTVSALRGAIETMMCCTIECDLSIEHRNFTLIEKFTADSIAFDFYFNSVSLTTIGFR